MLRKSKKLPKIKIEKCTNCEESTASDLISRRSVFSKRYYGSVEQLDSQNGNENSRRFRVENGGESQDEMFAPPCTPILENPEHQTRWYFKYFLGKLHQNYGGIDSEKTPFFLSIVQNSQEQENSDALPIYRAILFKKTGAQKISTACKSGHLNLKHILGQFPASITNSNTNSAHFHNHLKEITSPEIQKDLLVLEEQEGSVNFKFGVCFMKLGQKSDDEILSNENASENFENFLTLLGEKIRLKDWTKYRGGLDTKADMTGEFSIYTIYEGHEIMFHVSCLLPYSHGNRQQLERKRHIGNDIVNIIYIDTEDNDDTELAHSTFSPTFIRSQFTHIFALVTFNKSSATYRLSVYSDENVPLFGPTLPPDTDFDDAHLFRDFLLVKLINGEKATFETPIFAGKRERTLDTLIRDMYAEYVTDMRHMSMLNRRALSDTLSSSTSSSTTQNPPTASSNPSSSNQQPKDTTPITSTSEELSPESDRQIEFIRIGQSLKLAAILRGDAPTSIFSSTSSKEFSFNSFSPTLTPNSGLLLGNQRRRHSSPPPWEAHCFYPIFPTCFPPHNGGSGSGALEGFCGSAGRIFCADSWFDNRLIVANEDGVHLIEEGSVHRQIFDKTIQVHHLDVIETYGILLAHVLDRNSTKEGKIYVFRLSEIEMNDQTSPPPKNRDQIKEHRLERTKGCHLYAITSQSGGRLKLCTAIGRKLLLYQWKHSSITCPSNECDSTVESFTLISEYSCNESPTMLTLLDYANNVQNLQICIGYKHHWDILNCATGTLTHFYTVDSVDSKFVKLVASIDMYDIEEDELQLLLCYNHTCHFQKLSKLSSNSGGSGSSTGGNGDFYWNTNPDAVVCAFPYAIAFTSNTMEIRLIVNGSLVHTVAMPKLRLIAAKNDIFFATTAPEFFPPGIYEKLARNQEDGNADSRQQTSKHLSNNVSPEVKPMRIYRIPLNSLSGSSSLSQNKNKTNTNQTKTPNHITARKMVEEEEVDEEVTDDHLCNQQQRNENKTPNL